MRTTVKRRVRPVAALLAFGLLLTLPAAGDDGASGKARRGARQWVPALGLTGSYYAQGQESAVESYCDRGGPGNLTLARCTQAGPNGRDGPPTAFAANTRLRDPHSGSDFALWPGVGLDLQLMTPQVIPVEIELPFDLNPRFFMSTEVVAVFPPTRSIANEGSLSELSPPEDNTMTGTGVPSQAIVGAGSETKSKAKTFQYGAQIGMSIPLDVGGRTLRIKPSVGWLQYKLDIKGAVLAAIKDDVNGSKPVGTGGSTFGTHVREIDLHASKTLTVNGIGPGIEVELESGQFGPIGATVFIGANAYKVLGDTKVKLKNEVTFRDGTAGGDGLLEDTYFARWEHEIDPWFYRLRLGIRLHYQRD
ncbi:MAG: hypothetical protein GY944_23695 [bacterium]|nr:hypothetical protein [bacterium]MCP5044044.1 hypothetical protein [bacterium]